jgi:hypothetical protein
VSYAPVVLTQADDYDGVRALLGVDDATLTDATIELLPFLPRAESRITDRVPTYATILATPTTDAAKRLRMAACYLAAALLARHWAIARQAEEVTAENIGPARWSYRSGPEWKDVSKSLADEGNGLLARAYYGGINAMPRITVVATAGPTKTRREADDPTELEEWLSKVYPAIVDPEEASDW